MTKNEERIIGEVLSKNERFVDSIYTIDGSADSTPQIIKKFKKVRLILFEKDLIERFNAKRVDGIRQFLLDEIRKREGYGNWITLLHGDEIYYHSPRKVIQVAEAEKADGVRWYAMHFFLHSSDRKKWERIKNLPVEQRITHYAINESPWSELRQFKFHQVMKYERSQHSCCQPKGIKKIFSKKPIYKHYKTYCLEQFQIYKGRWGGLPLTPRNPQEEIFMEKLPGYKYAIKFDGGFGKFEKGLEKLR